MNQSPNSFGDIIRIENSNLGEIGVAEINGDHYVTESSIESFMEENNIASKSQLIESLIDFNNIQGISILDESTSDETLSMVRDVMMLCEDIHPFSINNTSNGNLILKSSMSQMIGIISRGKYNSAADLDRYIRKCDSMLEDIREEKKNVREKKSKVGQFKFSCMFLFNICKTVFFTFVIPLAVTSNVQWPDAIKKMFIKNGAKAATGFTAKHIGKVSMGTIAKASLIGIDAAIYLPPDLKGLYLSIADYEKLLNQYELDIQKTKRTLIQQKHYLENQRR